MLVLKQLYTIFKARCSITTLNLNFYNVKHHSGLKVIRMLVEIALLCPLMLTFSARFPAKSAVGNSDVGYILFLWM
jgi:hypothetical protein